MFLVGLVFVLLGISTYIVHFFSYNHYLRKNCPHILEHIEQHKNKNIVKERKKDVKVIFVRSNAPSWVFFIGVVSAPLFTIGIAIMGISLLIKFLIWIF